MAKNKISGSEKIFADIEALLKCSDRIQGPPERQPTYEEQVAGVPSLRNLKTAINGEESPTKAEWMRAGEFPEVALRRAQAGRIEFETLQKIVAGLQKLGKFKPVLKAESFLLSKADFEERKKRQATMSAKAATLSRPAVAHAPATKAQSFVGREFAFEFFEGFVSSNPSGYVIVEGAPGIGKTCLLAELARRWNLPAHFNVRATGIVRVDQFLENIHGQLSERFGLDQDFPAQAAQDGRYIEQLIEQSAQRLPPKERLICVVDALDEGEECTTLGVNPFFLPTSLPAGVFLVVSRRSHTCVIQVDCLVGVLDLMQHGAENRQDADLFIRAALEDLTALDGLSNGIDTEGLVDLLLERSESNFMYLHYVLQDLRQGKLGIKSISRLPFGLRGYYERHWEKMTAGKSLNKSQFSTIYALAELGRPVSASLLANCIGEDELLVHHFLNAWSQFLEISKVHDSTTDRPVWLFSLYHKSFADFLMEKGTIQAAKVDLGDLRQHICDGLLSGFKLD